MKLKTLPDNFIDIEGYSLDINQNGLHKVATAVISVSIETEKWNMETQSWVYNPQLSDAMLHLELGVEDKNGEDGQLKPSLHATIPNILQQGSPLSILSENKIKEPDILIDAWYGNDTPELINNHLQCLQKNNNQFLLSWTADIDLISELGSFQYYGWANIASIEAFVMTKAEIDILEQKLFSDGLTNWSRRVFDDYPEFVQTNRPSVKVVWHYKQL